MHAPFNGDDIVEVSLLEHSWNLQVRNSEPHLLWRRKQSSWGRNLRHQGPQRLLHPSQNDQKLPSQWNTLSELTLQVPLFLHPLHQNPAATLPRKQRNLSEGLRLCKASSVIGSSPTSRRVEGYPTGGGNSSPFTAQRMSSQ